MSESAILGILADTSSSGELKREMVRRANTVKEYMKVFLNASGRWKQYCGVELAVFQQIKLVKSGQSMDDVPWNDPPQKDHALRDEMLASTFKLSSLFSFYLYFSCR